MILITPITLITLITDPLRQFWVYLIILIIPITPINLITLITLITLICSVAYPFPSYKCTRQEETSAKYVPLLLLCIGFDCLLFKVL